MNKGRKTVGLQEKPMPMAMHHGMAWHGMGMIRWVWMGMGMSVRVLAC